MKSNFVEHQLPNGLRIVCETMPNVHSAAAGFLVLTGSRHEQPHEHGVSHFLEHMCFKGNARRDWHQINVRFDELGSIYNAFTGKEHTVYYGWVPCERLMDQLELLSGLVRPGLPEEEFQTERNVILEEIAMNGDSFGWHVSNFLHQTVFAGHPLAHEILGERETIASLPLGIMRDYWNARYAPQNMCLIATGQFDPQELFAQAAKYCADWGLASDGVREIAAPQEFPTGVRKLPLERFQQQELIVAFPCAAAADADEENLEAFCALFGGSNSRCYWNIVQKGIASSAGAAWISYRDCGILALYAEGDPQNCEMMLEALRAEARKVMEDGFTPEEVSRVRNQRRTHLALEGENPRTRLMQLVDDIETRGYPRTGEARLAAAEAVTPESISRCLRRFPIDREGVLLSIGPRNWPA